MVLAPILIVSHVGYAEVADSDGAILKAGKCQARVAEFCILQAKIAFTTYDSLQIATCCKLCLIGILFWNVKTDTAIVKASNIIAKHFGNQVDTPIFKILNFHLKLRR